MDTLGNVDTSISSPSKVVFSAAFGLISTRTEKLFKTYTEDNKQVAVEAA